MRSDALRDPIPVENRLIDVQQIYPLLRDTLEQGSSVRIAVDGNSMRPTICGGRDRVILVQAPERLKKYDLPLYRRSSGKFVLHRVVDIAPDGSYTMCGDHQWKREPGITQEQIAALVQTIERKGKSFSVENGHYRRWVRFWGFLLPVRRYIIGAAALPRRIKRRIIHRK